MTPLLVPLFMCIVIGATPLPAGDGDGDGTQTIEAEILKTLLDNGAITEKQYFELIEKAKKLRAQRIETHEELDKEIKRLTESIEEKIHLQDTKKTEPTATVSWKNGIYISSTDGNYVMHPWLVIRERFTFDDIGNVTGMANEDVASFEARVARLWFDGHAVTPDLTYLVMVDFAGAATLMRDSWIDHKFDEAFHLRAGQQKRPLDYEAFTYTPRTSFVDKAPAVLFFQRNAGEDFEPGLTAWGKIADNKLEWRAGLFNGDAPNNGALPGTTLGPGGGGFLPAQSSNNDSAGLEAVARVMWSPLGPIDTGGYFVNGYGEGDYERTQDAKFAIGSHYSYNPERNNGANVKMKQRIQTWGADAVFKYQGWFALAEVFVRSNNRDFTPNVPDTTDNGYFAQLQYFFGSETPGRGFEVMGRWSSIDVDAATLGLVPVGGVTEVHDSTVGLNYLFNGHRLKLLSAYTYRNRLLRAAADVDDQIFQLQLQLIF